MLPKHTARASTLPDLYAKNNATQRPLAILGRQMKALRDFSVKCGPENLPMHEGLQKSTKYKTTGGPPRPKRGPTHLGPRECETQER